MMNPQPIRRRFPVFSQTREEATLGHLQYSSVHRCLQQQSCEVSLVFTAQGTQKVFRDFARRRIYQSNVTLQRRATTPSLLQQGVQFLVSWARNMRDCHSTPGERSCSNYWTEKKWMTDVRAKDAWLLLYRTLMPLAAPSCSAYFPRGGNCACPRWSLTLLFHA